MAGLASAEAQTYRNVDSDSTRLARARELAERALAIDPRLTRALFTSGELRAVSFDYLGAERVFRKVLEIEPRSYQAWDYLCWSLGYQTPPRAAEAESACRRAIEINPGYAESYYHLARALLPQGRVPDAEEALRQLAEHVPDSGLIPFGSYWVQMASGRPGDALTTLETHLPFEKTALRMASTAMALSMMGRRDQAFQVLEQALRTGYRDGAALLGNPYFEPLRSDPRFVRLLADSGLGPGGSAPPPPSIAVLPFADMSPGHDQEYFADGVAEEILNALAHVEGLKVIARTSSFSFKGKNDDLRRIGQQLDVAHVLEGSLRKDGDQIRVTAQLIRVADGSHVWSETYDRRLTGIFKVQDEIARAVVTRLKGALLPGFSAPAERQGTTPAAYEQYLIGLHGGGESREGYQVGLAAFERAVALDPDYAPAWAELASNIFWNLAIYGGDRKAGLARAAMAAERAVRLGPGLASAFLARGLLRSHVDWDWKGSQADFERALTLDPGSSLAKRRYGVLLCELGRLEEAVPWLEGAVALDPLSAGSWNAVGSNFVDLGRFDQARRALQRGLAVRPNHVLLTQNLGDIDLLEGRPQAALDLYRTINSESYRLEGEAMALHTLGRHAESRQALAILEARFGESNPTMVAEVNAWRGDREAAFRWLDRAAAVHDTGLRELKDNRYLKSLRADPRYKALLRTMKLPVD
jgi:TolB-like protein/Tfp pilus assembly protein PilF